MNQESCTAITKRMKDCSARRTTVGHAEFANQIFCTRSNCEHSKRIGVSAPGHTLQTTSPRSLGQWTYNLQHPSNCGTQLSSEVFHVLPSKYFGEGLAGYFRMRCRCNRVDERQRSRGTGECEVLRGWPIAAPPLFSMCRHRLPKPWVIASCVQGNE